MSKDIIGLVNFMLDNNSFCDHIENKLTIICEKLQANFFSIENEPDFIRITIREFGMSSNQDIISKIVGTEDIKDLISDVWSEIEKIKNKRFIDEYGIEIYKKFHDSYMLALSGEKENNEFIFSVEKNDERVEINLHDKKNRVNHCAILSMERNDSKNYSYGAAEIRAGALVTAKKGSEYRFRSEGFLIYIPAIKFDKYDLGLSIKKPYDENNFLNYLISNIKEEENKKLLSVLELSNKLEIKDKKVEKKWKI